MARRNMIAIVERESATINHDYDLQFTELGLLHNMAKKGYPLEAISTAFRYGYILGQRALKAEQTKSPASVAAPTGQGHE